MSDEVEKGEGGRKVEEEKKSTGEYLTRTVILPKLFLICFRFAVSNVDYISLEKVSEELNCQTVGNLFFPINQ